MLLPRQHAAGYLVNHAARQFGVLLAERLKPLGLAPAQNAVLLVLWQEDGLSQRELVEILDVRQATVAKTLDRMERDGLIARAPHPNDARSKLICLTEKARALEVAVTGIARSVNNEVLAVLNEKERGQFLEMLNRIIEHQRSLTGDCAVAADEE